jgi:LmbE family N-acetylglucosaminyl deacetylase
VERSTVLNLTAPPGPLSILCLGAHPDDIEIGCGGTLLAVAERPEVDLAALVLTGSPARAAESREALSGLAGTIDVTLLDFPDGRLPSVWNEVKDALEAHARTFRPDVVLAPRVDDAHQDHRLIGRLVATVWRDALALHYEIPKWDGDLGAPSHYVALTAEQASRKVELLNRHFPSQRERDWWDDELFLGLMRLRGVECRSPYAEAYFAGKVVVDLVGGPNQTRGDAASHNGEMA